MVPSLGRGNKAALKKSRPDCSFCHQSLLQWHYLWAAQGTAGILAGTTNLPPTEAKSKTHYLRSNMGTVTLRKYIPVHCVSGSLTLGWGILSSSSYKTPTVKQPRLKKLPFSHNIRRLTGGECLYLCPESMEELVVLITLLSISFKRPPTPGIPIFIEASAWGLSC